MTGLFAELRVAVRRLFREPSFTVPAVATLSVGVGIAASVFALFYGVLLRPLPYPDAGRLVSIRHRAPGADGTRDRVSPGMYLHYRDGHRVFEGIGAYWEVSFTLTDGGVTERIRGAGVTPELLAVLRVEPSLGRLPALSDHAFDFETGTGTVGALVGHDLWIRRYGADPGVIGSVIETDGQPIAVVTGVTPEGFSFPDGETEVWLAWPQELSPFSRTASVRDGLIFGAVARLLPGVTPREAEADLDRLVGLLPEAYQDVTAEDLEALGIRAVVRPFKDEVVGDVRLALLVVLASGGFLLLVTWANVTNLLLLRTEVRRVEIGIARALGATERNVARRLLGESLLLTTAGALMGLGVANVATQLRFGFAPGQLPRLDEVGVDAVVAGVVLALALVSGALMAAVCHASTRQRAGGPALTALRSRSATEGREAQTGRRVLVAAQMALALTLLVGSGLMARTFLELRRVDPGFQPGGRIAAYVPVTHIGWDADYHDHARIYDELFARLGSLPGVEAVEAATSSVFPLTLQEGGHDAVIARADGVADAEGRRTPALYGLATPGYFDAMGIPILSGRRFETGDTSEGAPGVIISRSLARDLFGDEDPIGRAVDFVGWGWAPMSVVGVAGDVPATALREGGTRAVYLPHVYPPAAEGLTRALELYTPRFETVVIRTDRDAGALVAELRAAVEAVDRQVPLLDVASLDEVVAGASAGERIVLRLLLVSAAAALFLGVVGVYGVLAYSVRQRTAEIGIRLALGATPGRVTRLVVLQGAGLGATGIVAGLAAAFGLTRFIGALLYETSPTDPLTFAGTTALLLGAALLASYLPARRASRIDPAGALRAE